MFTSTSINLNVLRYTNLCSPIAWRRSLILVFVQRLTGCRDLSLRCLPYWATPYPSSSLYMRHNMHEFTNSDKLMPLLFSYAYQYHQGGTVISAFDFSFNENSIFNCWITFILYSRSSHLNLTQSRHSKLFTVFSSLQTDPFMHCTIQIVSFCWARHATNL